MSHIPPILVDLALILVSAAVTTVLFKKLKQPVVLGYILAGFLVGPGNSFFPSVSDGENIAVWAEIGIIFLLFALGLEFSFKKLVKVGGNASITGIIEISGMMLLGYMAGKFLGWSSIDCIFLGGILAISSTTIILRAVDELGLKTQKYVSHVFGVLIIEDVVAVLLLVLLSTVAVSQQFDGAEMAFSVFKLGFFLLLWFLLGIFLLPSILKAVKKHLNEETMLVVAVGLCFLMVVLATGAGFSAALGAFVMGSILAETTHAEAIEHILKPLKNLFGAIFFVSVGMLINPTLLAEYIFPVILLSGAVLFGKSLFITVGSIVSGQPLRPAVQSGMTMAQIGEFSFIIATLGQSLNVTSDYLYPIAVGVSVVTTFTTPYMMKLSNGAVKTLEFVLPDRWQQAIIRYSKGTMAIPESSQWKGLLKQYSLALAVNGVVLIFILITFNRWLTPEALSLGYPVWLTKLCLSVVGITLMSPFLWALSLRKIGGNMVSALWVSNRLNKGPLIVIMLTRIGLAIFLLGAFLDALYSAWVAAIGAVIISVIAFYFFSKRLRKLYLRIENQFFQNLNARELESKGRGGHLAPWDAHISYYEISPHSVLAGKKLFELSVREKFGVNIVSIERANQMIAIPERGEVLFPYDKIGVIGTDAQLKGFSGHIAADEDKANFLKRDVEMELISLDTKKCVTLIGKSIRNSGIKKLQGLVVGIERGGQRKLNPHTTEIIKSGDVLWVVGEKNKLKQLMG